jgi:hypothetical protein
MRFNRTMEYGTIYGHPDVAFEQLGHYFRPDGTEVDLDQVNLNREQDSVSHLDAAIQSIDTVRQKRSDAIKAGIARKRAMQPSA